VKRGTIAIAFVAIVMVVVAVARGSPLRVTVWPVNTFVVEVPAESVSVTGSA
jgi:hypothetical protein